MGALTIDSRDPIGAVIASTQPETRLKLTTIDYRQPDQKLSIGVLIDL